MGVQRTFFFGGAYTDIFLVDNGRGFTKGGHRRRGVH